MKNLSGWGGGGGGVGFGSKVMTDNMFVILRFNSYGAFFKTYCLYNILAQMTVLLMLPGSHVLQEGT
jgi:hypothetical protein